MPWRYLAGSPSYESSIEDSWRIARLMVSSVKSSAAEQPRQLKMAIRPRRMASYLRPACSRSASSQSRKRSNASRVNSQSCTGLDIILRDVRFDSRKQGRSDLRDYKTPVLMRKQIGGGKTRPLAAAERNFSPAHEISRQELSLLKENVLFQLAASSADVTPASDIGVLSH